MRVQDRESLFPDTRWTEVGLANGSSLRSAEALGALLVRYMPALRTHLVCRRRVPADQTDDLLHGFVADKILMGNLLARADRQRGRFRSFLLTALDRYLISAIRREHTERRSPGRGLLLSLDEHPEQAEAAPAAPPGATAFDVAWTRAIIQETLGRVQELCNAHGRAPYWALFEARVVGPMLHGHEPEPYARLVERLGFASPVQAASALVTVKNMFERMFRAVVREYAGNDDEVDREISDLRAILAAAGAYQRT